jgi:hypothetical protein
MSAATKAKIIDHALIASFRDSNPPTVWRMDLEKNHSFAVAIQGREGDWELGIMSPRGEFTVVARFASRAEIDGAFAAVQKALMSPPNSLLAKLKRVALVTATIVLVLIAGAKLLDTLPSSRTTVALTPQPSQMAAPAAPAAPAVPIQSGIPLPADEVLKAQ